MEKLCTILAQLEYIHLVNLLHSKGAHFKDHLYVSEVHPITDVEFCEQGDEGHIFKVCLHENIGCLLISLLTVSGRVGHVTFNWSALKKHFMTQQLG